MARKTAHRVTATMIVAKVPGAQGGEVYLRKGRTLPASVDADEIKRLAALGLVERFEIEDAEEGAGADSAGRTGSGSGK